ncbi:unnamed protein product [Tuber melanosporum]|uniref:(Perigord truffle) hypothetical protein n=1 Tax=Tuber melanosporum (strain Mel28) TaxID=656061 RepID=D5G839_TUBMM|nr:uncharacterized protein GSTUM_00002796001 [Tuber melanosporum]CAZ80682.1 unnamed protein product [Tuber melanosporum]
MNSIILYPNHVWTSPSSYNKVEIQHYNYGRLHNIILCPR